MDTSAFQEHEDELIASFVCFSPLNDKSFVIIVLFHPSYQRLFADAATRYLHELTRLFDPDRLTFENKKACIKEMQGTFHEATGIFIVSITESDLEGALFGDVHFFLTRGQEEIPLIYGNFKEVVDIKGPLQQGDIFSIKPEIEGIEECLQRLRTIDENNLETPQDFSDEEEFVQESVVEVEQNEDHLYVVDTINNEAYEDSNDIVQNEVETPHTIVFQKRLKVFDPIATEKRRKRLSFYGGLAILVLIFLVLIGTPVHHSIKKKKTLEDELASARLFVENLEGLKALEPEVARTQFENEKGKVLALTAEDEVKVEADSLLARLQSYEKELFKEQTVMPELFSDLSLQSQNFIGRMMSTNENMLYILNSKGDAVIEISLESKRSRVLLGPSEIGDASMIAAYPGRVFLLRNNKIYVFDANGREIADYEGGGGTIRSFVAYTGNLYTLEPDMSMIYKLQGKEEGGYSPSTPWIREGIETNLEGAREMSIDGTIWTLSGEKDVNRMSLGNISTFYMPKIEPTLSRIDLLYTNESLESTYFFDASNNRIVEIAKTGELKLQYLIPEEIQIDSFVVSKETLRIYLLSGSKIYVVNL